MPIMCLGLYLAVRLGLDSVLWRNITPYAAYAFELVFVIIVGWFYRQRLKCFGFRPTQVLTDGLLPLGAGFATYKLALFSLLPIPFDLQSTELIFLLLIVAPVLEELIFRMALWEPIKDLTASPAVLLVSTTLLFSFGHLQALWSVPQELRAFVLYQSLYVIILGLGAGWRRLQSQTLLAPILVHFSFNLGFFLASRF